MYPHRPRVPGWHAASVQVLDDVEPAAPRQQTPGALAKDGGLVLANRHAVALKAKLTPCVNFAVLGLLAPCRAWSGR